MTLSNRIESVDVFRLIAIIAIIIIHVSPFREESNGKEIYSWLDILINQSARFAVPFFFVISGYFWGIKIKNGHNPVSTSHQSAKRIAVIFLAWCIIYLFPYNITKIHNYGWLGPIKVAYWTITNLIRQPLVLFLQGTKVHLWFLVSLIFSLYICAVFMHFKAHKSLLCFSIVLYIFGVLSKAYADTPIGIKIEFNTRNGPFWGTVLFVTGYFISRHTIDNRWFFYGFMVFIFGLVMHFLEIYSAWKFFGVSLYQDYVFGTYFMGVGVALVSVSNHRLLRSQLLSQIGQMTLGIYAIHYVYVDIFRPVYKQLRSPLWEISYVVVVIVLSISSSIILSKNRITRKIIM